MVLTGSPAKPPSRTCTEQNSATADVSRVLNLSPSSCIRKKTELQVFSNPDKTVLDTGRAPQVSSGAVHTSAFVEEGRREQQRSAQDEGGCGRRTPSAMSNREDNPGSVDDLWVFGYGSLIWRPDLPAVESRHGVIYGWRRRFWQGEEAINNRRASTMRKTLDMRVAGDADPLTDDPDRAEGAPGRVVTLISKEQLERLGAEEEEGEEGGAGNEDEGWSTYGVAYRIASESQEEVLDRLDCREWQFERHAVTVYDYHNTGTVVVPNALIYIANESNPNWLGPSAGLDAIAKQIVRSHGPSGANIEYFLRLVEALRAQGIFDSHIMALEQRILPLIEKGNEHHADKSG